MLFAVVLVVSGALVVGAAWGIYGKLPERLEGFLVALAGGAQCSSSDSPVTDFTMGMPGASRKLTWC